MKIFIASILTLILLLIPIFNTTSLSDSKIYLALGDSISTGYGIADSKDFFVNILAKDIGYTAVNRAVNGSTISDVAASLADGNLDSDIKNAAIITITCGGNDMMALLYNKLAEEYNKTFAVAENEYIAVGDIMSILSDSSDKRRNLLMLCALTVLEGNPDSSVPTFADSEEFKKGIGSFLTGLNSVTDYIRTINKTAKIVVTTQYNPYKSFAGFYDILAQGIGQGVQVLNAAIKLNASVSDYLVADVYSAFESSTENLLNADCATMNLDVHPNTNGHALIARCIKILLKGALPFDDVSVNDWFYDAVDYVYSKKIFNGTGESTFSPEEPVTRAMLVTALYRSEGMPEVNCSNRFSDVHSDSFYEKAVVWAAENGIVNGCSATAFCPDDFITREQLAAIIFRYAGFKGTAATDTLAVRTDYTDSNDISGYAAEGIMYCTLKGIMQGDKKGCFNPKSNATRAEAAAIFKRLV